MATTISLPFSLAGAKLGLSAEDLAEKYGLTDDQAEGIYTEFDQAEPPKMTETTYKGRGARTLGYQVGGLPTRTETIFENFAPAYKPLEAGETTEKTPEETPEKVLPKAPTEKADMLLSSFIGELGDKTGGTIGAMGVGQAMGYGYTKPEILAKAKQEGLTFGQQAALGLDLPYASNLTGARGSSADPNYPNALGLSAVKRLESEGYSPEAIQGLAAQQGIKFGEAASSYLGGAPRVSAPAPARASAPASSPAPSMSSFVGSGGTSGYMGQQAVQRAKAAGMSESQIRNLAAQQGLQFGAKAFA
jgi:hypothetical protein